MNKGASYQDFADRHPEGIWHTRSQIFLEKMTCLDFKTPVIKWFESNKSNRKFFVSVDGVFSEAGMFNSFVVFGTVPVFNMY